MKRVLLISLLILICSHFVMAQDTIVVQTLNFDDITKRRGWYEFPDNTNSYEKILMYYTLKCDAATTGDPNPCHEWDYSTFTNIFKHENIGGDRYLVNNSYPDTIPYTNTTTYTLYQSNQDFIVYDNIISELNYNIGTGNIGLNSPLSSSASSSKAQYLYTASELTSAGLTTDNIDKLKLDISSLGTSINNLIINIKATSQTALNTPETGGFTKVFQFNPTLTNGINIFNFTTPFDWDGTSNIVVEIDHTNTNPDTNSEVNGSDAGFNSSLYTTSSDGYLNFDREDDYVSIANNSTLNFTSSFSIEAWVNPSLFNSNYWENTIVGKDSDESGGSGYVLRCGDTGIISFVLGTNSGWKEVTTPPNTLAVNTWQHVTATYDGSNLKIYVDGVQKASGSVSGTINANSMDLQIGAGYNGGGRKFKGKIDEVRIWSTALNPTDINNWMFRSVTALHPNYADLTALYDFNDNQNIGKDISVNGFDGVIYGFPFWESFNGNDIFKGFTPSTERPNIIFTQGDYNSHIESMIATDSIVNPKTTAVRQITSVNNEAGVNSTSVDTITFWDPGWNYTFNDTGDKVDSVFNAMEGQLINEYRTSTIELQNYVTPYGLGLDLGPNGFRWIYDVTDYTTLLHDSVDFMSGSQGELHDVKFIMIKGTPPRKPIDVKQINLGSASHAFIANDIAFPAVDITLNPDAAQYRVKTRTTGHGFGPNNYQNCAEFCPKLHHVEVDGVMRFEWNNWKECANNPLIDQGGTWIYDRAGWCPGTFADTHNYELTPFVTPGTNVSLNYGMQTTAGGMDGDYLVSFQLVSYEAPNFTLDARLEEIISPNDWEYQNRVNPICNEPKIVIKNTGTSTLTSLTIKYNVEGGAEETYNWTGNLEFLETEEVVLPIPTQSFWETSSSNNIFKVSVSAPNGGTDEYEYNNSASSTFEKPDIYSDKFILEIKTNNAAYENSYTIKDDQGNIVMSRSGMSNSTVYKDTVNLPNGCYVLDFLDSDDDGLSFFANGDGNGYLRIKSITNTLYKTFNPNFGSYIKYYFVLDDNVGIETNDKLQEINISPNPSQNIFNLSITGFENETVNIEIYNVTGKVIHRKSITSNNNLINTSFDLSDNQNGIYFVKVFGKNLFTVKKIIKN